MRSILEERMQQTTVSLAQEVSAKTGAKERCLSLMQRLLHPFL
jgi:hypothetical protein